MTFNPSKPVNAESPALFPLQNRNNMSRLQSMFQQDHQFNDVAATNDGWHKMVHWVEQPGQLNPLNPGATAPSNAGGPPISWEQEDSYGVERMWFRGSNDGQVHSMNGQTEVRIDNFSVPTASTVLFVPPDDSYGDIFYVSPLSIGLVWRASYWKSGGSVSVTSTEMNGPVPYGPIEFITSITVPITDFLVRSRIGSPIICNFRILYRYLF